ncbi:hypothetical protein NSTC745_03322 [Nostoc sp. DSM 114161]|jgi:hypothetical protein
MNVGAVVLFLHADTRLTAGFDEMIARLYNNLGLWLVRLTCGLMHRF